MVGFSGASASPITLQQRLSPVEIPFSDPNPVVGGQLGQVIRGNFSVFSVVKSQEPLDGANMLTFYVHLKNGSHNATARFTSVGIVQSIDIVENYRNNLGYAVIVEKRPYTLGPVSMVSVVPINGSKINWYGGTRDPVDPLLAKVALDEFFLSLLVVENPSTLAIYQAPWRNLTGSWPFRRNFTVEDVTDLVTLSSPEGFVFITHSNISYTTRVYTYSLQTQKITQWDTQAFDSESSPLKSQILQFLTCRVQKEGLIRCATSVVGAYLVEFVLDPAKSQIVSQHKHMKYAESFILSTDIFLGPTDNSCYILAAA